MELPCPLQVCQPPSISRSSLTPELSKPTYFGDFLMEVSLGRHQLLTQSPAQKMGGGTESSKLLIMVSSPQFQSLPGAHQDPPHQNKRYSCHPEYSKGIQKLCIRNKGQRPTIRTKKMLLETISLRKLQRFQELWPGTRDKDENIYLFLCSYTYLFMH